MATRRVKPAQFGKVPTWVAQKATPGGVKLYAWLAGRYGGLATTTPGQDRLADELSVSVATVGNWLADLKRIGAVTTEQRGSTSSRYLLATQDPNP